MNRIRFLNNHNHLIVHFIKMCTTTHYQVVFTMPDLSLLAIFDRIVTQVYGGSDTLRRNNTIVNPYEFANLILDIMTRVYQNEPPIMDIYELIFLMGMMPHEYVCDAYAQFKILENRTPETAEEFKWFLNNYQQIMENPDQYCNNNRHFNKLSESDLMSLLTLDRGKSGSKSEMCMYCTDSTVDEVIFVLPCEHGFHKRDCMTDKDDTNNLALEDLKTNKKCPMCRSYLEKK